MAAVLDFDARDVIKDLIVADINVMVNSLYRAGASAIALWLAVSSAQAAIIEVHEGERIQDAVNQAAPGDEIRVYPGLYSETIYVDKDDITLRGIVEGDN